MISHTCFLLLIEISYLIMELEAELTPGVTTLR
jgi:hypothetical protein